MIVDVLKNNARYASLHPGFAKAFAFLEAAQKELPEVGRYEIDGDAVYAMVQQYDTVPAAETKWEAHKKYIDIQFIHAGTEVIAWDTIENLPEGTEYNETKDCFVFKGEGKSPVELNAGTFAIYFPEDLHKPKEQYKVASPVTKIVVKVLV
ncbi:MAG: YhcH/YjgK/YiaL family protein [Clostridia bacterium]|nr:YhcH/YjgK/YiaL family protein [Clostridia bacterium]